MKKIIEKLNKNKNMIIGIVVGAVAINLIGIISSIAATTVQSDIVLYDSSTGKKNVKDAIDELYTMASTHCPDEYNCFNKNSGVTLVNGNGTTEGDEIKIGSEHFYVISNDGINIKLLSKLNITLDTIDPEQSVSFYPLAFIDSNDDCYFKGTVNSFVYNKQSNLHSYIEAYKNKLITLGLPVINATLITEEEARNLVKTKNYAWSYNQSYWAGTGYGKNGCGVVGITTDKYVIPTVPDSKNLYGIRPVIEIPASSL